MEIDKTWLFIPAKEKYMCKLPSIRADHLILDLEDSLTGEQKEPGLELVYEACRKYGGQRSIYVRVNSEEGMERELNRLCACPVSGFMLPKFEDVSVLERLRESLAGKQVIALVESVRGIIRLEETAAHPMVNVLAFGGEDFCRELGYGAGEEAALFAKSKLVLYAAYHGKTSLDTVSFEIRDMEKFLLSYKKSRRMGFSGKLLIHPAQAQAVCAYCGEEERKRLRHIVEVFRESGEGLVEIDGSWYEKPHIKKIEAYLHSLEGEDLS